MHSTLFFAEIPNPGADWPKSIDFHVFLTNFLIIQNFSIFSLILKFFKNFQFFSIFYFLVGFWLRNNARG